MIAGSGRSQHGAHAVGARRRRRTRRRDASDRSSRSTGSAGRSHRAPRTGAQSLPHPPVLLGIVRPKRPAFASASREARGKRRLAVGDRGIRRQHIAGDSGGLVDHRLLLRAQTVHGSPPVGHTTTSSSNDSSTAPRNVWTIGDRSSVSAQALRIDSSGIERARIDLDASSGETWMARFADHGEMSEGVVHAPFHGRLDPVDVQAAALGHHLQADQEVRAERSEEILQRGDGFRFRIELQRPAGDESVPAHEDVGTTRRIGGDAAPSRMKPSAGSSNSGGSLTLRSRPRGLPRSVSSGAGPRDRGACWPEDLRLGCHSESIAHFAGSFPRAATPLARAREGAYLGVSVGASER